MGYDVSCFKRCSAFVSTFFRSISLVVSGSYLINWSFCFMWILIHLQQTIDRIDRLNTNKLPLDFFALKLHHLVSQCQLFAVDLRLVDQFEMLSPESCHLNAGILVLCITAASKVIMKFYFILFVTCLETGLTHLLVMFYYLLILLSNSRKCESVSIYESLFK